ncbi:hypothetical protein ACFQL1_17940 [Halomicroarcula sp. GCM10025709]|uniref:hypothetical protein n=1 Tax=Haloarcula TaxID=2237 RepID=UPI0024C2DF2D|nr:hypothetical protein [Halomicroarcula sp. YJ-61-S]
MERRALSDGGTAVDPRDRDALSEHLRRFAGDGEVDEAGDGTLRVRFGRSTFVAVAPDGTVTTGMPLHGFDGTAERLVFDHDAGELHVAADGVSYTFRRP